MSIEQKSADELVATMRTGGLSKAELFAQLTQMDAAGAGAAPDAGSPAAFAADQVRSGLCSCTLEISPFPFAQAEIEDEDDSALSRTLLTLSSRA